VLYAKIPRCMKDDNLRLRPLRIFDGPFIGEGLRDEVVSKANGLSSPISSSWWVVWWWIKRTFVITYCIECDSRRIGFVGLYDLRLGELAEISIAIFDKNVRRLGYGTKAFTMLSQNLRKYSIAKKILVRVKADNGISISFLQKLGFVEISAFDGIISMSLELDNLCF
jgi:RimJ/RimL family protein N-acetyltransferase